MSKLDITTQRTAKKDESINLRLGPGPDVRGLLHDPKCRIEGNIGVQAMPENAKGSSKPLTPLKTYLRMEDDQSFLGAPPLIPFDDPAAYNGLLGAVTEAMKPADFFEVMWTRDITDLQWEITRFRRIKANFIKAHLQDDFGDDDEAKEMSAVINHIPTIESLEHMIATYEGRRNAACREAERHRANLGNRLQRAAEQVEDAEFSEVDETSEQKRVA